MALGINLLVWWLALESLWNSVVVVQLEEDVLTVFRPLQHRSLLMRKKHHRITIRPEEWDTLFHSAYKNATSYYFRNFFSADGFSDLARELQDSFPDKEVKVPKHGMPVDVLRDLRW